MVFISFLTLLISTFFLNFNSNMKIRETISPKMQHTIYCNEDLFK